MQHNHMSQSTDPGMWFTNEVSTEERNQSSYLSYLLNNVVTGVKNIFFLTCYICKIYFILLKLK